MYNMKVVATLSAPVQIGVDEWKQVRTSRVFSADRSIANMLTWAESEGIKSPTINDLTLSDYTGEST